MGLKMAIFGLCMFCLGQHLMLLFKTTDFKKSDHGLNILYCLVYIWGLLKINDPRTIPIALLIAYPVWNSFREIRNL